ncbi:MAG: ribonuclease R, partial [Bacteroidetes bacterium]|nr:ribonuclease R [Bacteroidota bacterium]
THKQVCSALDIKESALRKLVYDIMVSFSKEGILQTFGHGDFQYNNDANHAVGYLDLNTRGAGFVKVDGMESDIYISQQNVGNSLAGDLVKVQILSRGSRKWEGSIVEVLERERTQFVGTIQLNDNFAFLIPDNLRAGTDIYIPKEKLNGAKNKDKALVKITVWPKNAANPYGEVLEVLTNNSANDTEMISILVSQGIDYVFPQEVINEAEKISMDLDEEEIKKRRDMRDTLTFTIDPFDAKDFDDALSIKKLEKGSYEIGVHIADVGYYVTPGSALDTEALKRSNSVYLVDRVVPMLPEQISNLACSLRPNEDKFSFSAVFEITERGEVLKQWFGKTVIHSNHRFAYEDAQEIIEGKEHELSETILVFDKIAKILRNKRMDQGALTIDSEEIKFKLDEEGYPESVVIKRSKDANQLIEEFMLLANRKVAEFIGSTERKVQIPFIYRVHDKPDSSKIEVFRTFIDKFGLKLDFTHPDQIAKSLNYLLSEIKENAEYGLIQNMAIRSMAKATYETDNIGHYGLAFRYYTHFTSPIRRYADLMVHRILLEELNKQNHKYSQQLADICKKISRNERKASEAERESTKFFQTLFVLDKIGETFEGTVTGLTDHGMYVRMNENYCEGMVQLSQIPGDRYLFDSERFQITGKSSGRTFNIGDHVVVKIDEVHPRKRQIDLELLLD